MSFTAGLIVGCVALAVFLGLSALGDWLRKRRHRAHPSTQGRTEDCEVCGAEISIVVAHLVTDTFTDDATLAGGPAFGGTAMSAAYCVNDCPGGCSRGCEARNAS